eukprot:175280_1
MDDTSLNSDGLTFHLLIDIYNVHKCLLFSNEHFKDYDVNEFVKDIQDSTHLNPQTKQRIKSIGFEDKITTINLYPSYIIDDDMYQTCKYLFCASHIVHKQMENNN